MWVLGTEIIFQEGVVATSQENYCNESNFMLLEYVSEFQMFTPMSVNNSSFVTGFFKLRFQMLYFIIEISFKVVTWSKDEEK